MNFTGLESKVLLFNIENVKMESIIALCKRHGAIPLTVASTDQNKELGELAGFHKEIEDVRTEGIPAFTDEMMIFSMLPDLSDFLDDYKAMGLKPIPLKAVLTPSNMRWTAAKLHDELAKEHEAFKKMREG